MATKLYVCAHAWNDTAYGDGPLVERCLTKLAPYIDGVRTDLASPERAWALARWCAVYHKHMVLSTELGRDREITAATINKINTKFPKLIRGVEGANEPDLFAPPRQVVNGKKRGAADWQEQTRSHHAWLSAVCKAEGRLTLLTPPAGHDDAESFCLNLAGTANVHRYATLGAPRGSIVTECGGKTLAELRLRLGAAFMSGAAIVAMFELMERDATSQGFGLFDHNGNWRMK